jgi:hypothetical protein
MLIAIDYIEYTNAEEIINILGSIMTIEDILETNKLVNKL